MTDQIRMPNYQQIYRIEFYECEHEGDLDDYCRDRCFAQGITPATCA